MTAPSSGPEDIALPALRAVLEGVARVLGNPEERSAMPPAPGPGPAAGPSAGPPDDDSLLAAVEDVMAIPLSGVDVTALAADRVARWLRADRAMVLLADRPAGPLVARAALGFRRDDLDRVSVEPGEGLVGRAFQGGCLVAARTGLAEVGRDPFLDRFPVSEALAAPVRGEDTVHGVVFAGRRGPAPFSARDVLVLSVIAGRVGAALGMREVHDRRRGELDRLASLRQLVAGTAAGRDLRAVLARATEVAPALLGLPVAFVALAASAETLTVVAAHGLPASSLLYQGLRRDRGPVADVMASGEPLAPSDLAGRSDAGAAALLEAGLRASLILPVTHNDHALGVLVLADVVPREFSPEDVALGGVLAALVGATIASHRMADDLRAALLRMSSAQERLVQAERAHALGGMAAGLARELSQVFALIVGKSQWLLGRAQDEAAREALAALEEAAWQGADVVRRLEGLGDAAPGDAEPTDVSAAVREALAQLRARAGSEGDDLALRVDTVLALDPTPPVAVPAAALREAVLSLLVNAVDAMPTGGRLSVTARERDGGAELVVADTGEGIADEVRVRIFDPFFTTRASDRLGLGLTVVHGLVNRHAGRIDVASRVGVGTIVTVWLPPSGRRPAPPAAVRTPASDNGSAGPAEPAARAARPAPGATARQAAGEAGAQSPSAGGPAILVLDGEEVSRASIVEALGAAGYRVVSGPDAPTGIALLQTARPDLVLAALALPHGSGLGVARAAKRANPHAAVVLMAGWRHVLDPERLRGQGVDLLLVKPFRTDRLLAVVGEALRLGRPA
jgi:signal transduction histidine kinase